MILNVYTDWSRSSCSSSSDTGEKEKEKELEKSAKKEMEVEAWHERFRDGRDGNYEIWYATYVCLGICKSKVPLPVDHGRGATVLHSLT